jgi:sarcosine oxidase subunit beta
MKNKAQVVIIGGGCIGTSIAFFLAQAGIKDIILLEKEKFLASSSTGLCAGGIRQQFGTPVNIQICRASVEIFENFETIVGIPINFMQYGYLFLCQTKQEMELYRKLIKLQNSLQVPTREITPQEIKELYPWLNLERVVGGSFCPTDGLADPHEVTQAFACRAKELGVELCTETEATAIKVEAGKITGVETPAGFIHTPIVVNAAGPYARQVAAMAGIELPVDPVRRHLFITEPFKAIPDDIPMIIEVESGFYFRKESGGVLMGMANPKEAVGFNFSVDWDYMTAIVEKALNLAPVLQNANIMRGWAGLYEVSPDHHAILGKVPGLKGFYLANGFSGHGFMQSPAVGKLISAVITGQEPFIDISCLSYERFAQGKLIEETQVI